MLSEIPSKNRRNSLSKGNEVFVIRTASALLGAATDGECSGANDVLHKLLMGGAVLVEALGDIDSA